MSLVRTKAPASPQPSSARAIGLRPWIILTALMLGRAAVGYQYQTVATLGPRLIALFHLSYTDFGALIGAYMLLGAFTALPMGVLGRWLGDGPITSIGFVLMVAGAAVTGWMHNPSGIAAGRTLAGVGAVAMIVMQGKIIADWFSGRDFMLASSVVVCGYPIGVDLAQIALPPVAHSFGLPLSLLTGCILAVISLVLFVGSFRLAPGAPPNPQRFSLPSWREILLLVIAGMIWTAYTAGFAGYLSYVPTTLESRGAAAALVGVVITIATWGNIPSTLFGGGLAGRFGGVSILTVGTLAATIGSAATALTGAPVLCAVLVGFLGSIHPGVIFAVGTLSARQEHRAVGMGIFYALYFAGGTVGPTICGRAADLYGSPAGGLLAAAAMSALVIPLYLLHRALARGGLVPVEATLPDQRRK